jgi:hypothetical protein
MIIQGNTIAEASKERLNLLASYGTSDVYGSDVDMEIELEYEEGGSRVLS